MEKQIPSVAVVIISWNGKHFLEKFIPPLLKTTYQHVTFYVIDNASADDSVEFLSTHYPEIQVIALKENLGFAGGYNAGLKQIEADYYVLLNQDVEVTPGWIEPVIELLEKDEKTAIAQPNILDYTKRDYFEYAGAAGGFIDTMGYPFCRGRIFQTLEKNEGQYPENTEIFWATGACMFIKSKVYHALEGLDEDFFAHMEEIDLCWRARNRGYQLSSCVRSTVYHVGGGSLPQGNPRKTYLNFRNSLRMMVKNLPDNKFKRKIFFRLILDGIAGLQSLAKGKFSDIFAILKAHFNFYAEFSYWMSKRKKLKAGTTIYQKEFKGKGVYNGLLINAYFLKNKKKFSELEKERFEE